MSDNSGQRIRATSSPEGMNTNGKALLAGLRGLVPETTMERLDAEGRVYLHH